MSSPANDGKPNNGLPRPSVRASASDSKMVFIAEYGYLLAGGSLCFLLGIILTLVIVWIVILICNRQIALERIGTQSKVATVYAQYSLQNEAIKKPYINLSKAFNCTVTERRLSITDYQYKNLETKMELSFELGMKWAQEAVNRTAHAGLFTTILAAAVTMLLIEIFCVIIFIIYESKFKSVTSNEEAEQLNEKYSFLIQGPKVIHHGMFEVSSSLSNASLHVRNLVSRASNSLTDIRSKFTPRDRTSLAATTDMTITVRPPAPVTPPSRQTDATSGPQNHPISWHPYRQRPDSAKESYTASDARTEMSKSVGLNTLKEHLDKHNLLIPLSEQNSEDVLSDHEEIANESNERYMRYSENEERASGRHSGANGPQSTYDWNRTSGYETRYDHKRDDQSWASSR